MKTRLSKKCLNNEFPHTGEIHSKGVCKTCYAYAYAHKGKARPASLIIADLERKGEKVFTFESRAEEIIMYLATCRDFSEIGTLIEEARLLYSEKDPQYTYDEEQKELTHDLQYGDFKGI